MGNNLDPLISKQLLLEILELLHVGIYIVNSQGVLIFTNSSAAKLDHLNKERDIGRKISDIYKANMFEDLDSPTLDTLKTGRIHSHENLEWTLSDGTRINAITSSYPIERDGQIAGAFALSEDIAGLKRHLIKQGAFNRKQYYKLRREVLKNDTVYLLDDIIGSSEIIQNSISMARRLAEKSFPILIYGETGTGKEMFAQGVHNASSFAGGPFVAINCAAIPETLLESVLFGSVKGAFTGAMDKEGFFEKANNGTLFLDEINSMPIALQAKLLRAIQEKVIQRLGGSKSIKLSCRIISATNKEPHLAISKGEFREDLYYRLAMGVIWLPPLRERLDDIEELTEYFISKVNAEMDTTIIGASDALLQLFKTYKWPGNIRELLNVIANTIVMTADNDVVLDVEHMPGFMTKMICEDVIVPEKSTDGVRATTDWRNIEELPLTGNIDEMVDAYEEMLLRFAMESSGGRIIKAAEILKISRQSLYVKLKKYGIDKKAMIKKK